MTPVTVQRGDGPIVLGQPHGGTHVPADILVRLNRQGQALADTDWHIHRLYDGILPSATVVQSHIHRYVIDANRDPSGQSLYPGQNTTTLVPLTDFDGVEIWRDGQAPSADEVEARRRAYHAPYHAALAEELDRVKARHGFAVLYDCHSIRSNIPFLFDGTLPVFSLGTNNGQTCAPGIEAAVADIVRGAPGYDSVLNGRFKGGWTTRHYGRPAEGLHAIQMELAQRAYLAEEPPWPYAPARAGRLRLKLGEILTKLDTYARSGALAA